MSQVTSVRGQVIGKGADAARATSVRGQVLGKGADTARATSVRGQVLLGVEQSSSLGGQDYRSTYLALDAGDRPAAPIGSYARRIVEGLGLDMSARGSGSWSKIIAQSEEATDLEGSGSWRARALRFLRENAP